MLSIGGPVFSLMSLALLIGWLTFGDTGPFLSELLEVLLTVEVIMLLTSAIPMAYPHNLSNGEKAYSDGYHVLKGMQNRSWSYWDPPNLFAAADHERLRADRVT